MRLTTSILVSSILLISLAGQFQNLGFRQARADATALDKSEMLMSERGSGRDKETQEKTQELQKDAET